MLYGATAIRRMMGDYVYEYVYMKNLLANIYSFSNSSPMQKLISQQCLTCMTTEVKHHSAALMTSNTLCFLQLLLPDAWSHCLIWIQVLSVVTDIQISVRTCKAWTWSVGGTIQRNVSNWNNVCCLLAHFLSCSIFNRVKGVILLFLLFSKCSQLIIYFTFTITICLTNLCLFLLFIFSKWYFWIAEGAPLKQSW